MKVIHVRKEEVKLLFDMTVYVKNPKESTREC